MATTHVFKPELTSSLSAWQRAMDRLGREMAIDVSSRLTLAKATLNGVDPENIEVLRMMRLKGADLNWIINTRTLARRRQKGQRLTLEESGRLIRASKILFFALEVFGDNDRTLRWLHKANPNFEGLSPLELARTEDGGVLVLDTLNQVDAGFAA